MGHKTLVVLVIAIIVILIVSAIALKIVRVVRAFELDDGRIYLVIRSTDRIIGSDDSARLDLLGNGKGSCLGYTGLSDYEKTWREKGINPSSLPERISVMAAIQIPYQERYSDQLDLFKDGASLNIPLIPAIAGESCGSIPLDNQ